jgi:hypothetical protein
LRPYITAIELEVAAMMKLKGANQLWIRPFGMPNLVGRCRLTLSNLR